MEQYETVEYNGIPVHIVTDEQFSAFMSGWMNGVGMAFNGIPEAHIESFFSDNGPLDAMPDGLHVDYYRANDRSNPVFFAIYVMFTPGS